MVAKISSPTRYVSVYTNTACNHQQQLSPPHGIDLDMLHLPSLPCLTPPYSLAHLVMHMHHFAWQSTALG